jgi:deoxyribodipyrimidine photo-lyase
VFDTGDRLSSMTAPVAIVWFRRDLRLCDNPALAQALRSHGRVVPVYLHAPAEEGPWPPGGASRWWLHHALADLDEQFGGQLVVRHGPSLEALLTLAAEVGAGAVYWNRLYEPAAIERDSRIKRALRENGLEVQSFGAGYLFEPWEVMNRQGRPFRVFTPFWRELLRIGLPDRPVPCVDTVGRLLPSGAAPSSLSVDDLGLLPQVRWDDGLAAAWQPTRGAAEARLDEFVATDLARYATGRDLPGRDQVSRLSPYLHFGQLGPREAVAACRGQPGAEPFLRELGWREFAAVQLYHFPHTAEQPMDERFHAFEWREDPVQLEVWQRGRTGVPMVDAGMRQLWQTGWMHNRVRMIVASFLTKNLLLPWQAGARWFWDTLVDADLASNSLGWQWAAGSGADAAPYFRVFNPVLQGERFDASGDYVRRWVPELSAMPDKWLHRPWDAPPPVCADSGIRLGRDYPAPIVDLKSSRQRALDRWAAIR